MTEAQNRTSQLISEIAGDGYGGMQVTLNQKQCNAITEKYAKMEEALHQVEHDYQCRGGNLFPEKCDCHCRKVTEALEFDPLSRS